MFGKRLKELRKEKNLTQKELGDIIKVSDRVVGHYEADKHFPDGDTLIRIADYFNVTLDYLLGRTDIKNAQIYTQEFQGEKYNIAYTKEEFPKGMSREEAIQILIELIQKDKK